MNTAEVLLSELAYSWYESCEIVEWNVPKTKEWYSNLDYILKRTPKDAGEFGAIVRYTHDDELTTQWVAKNRVKLPPISEYIGL